jgi:hypothetical protein
VVLELSAKSNLLHLEQASLPKMEIGGIQHRHALSNLVCNSSAAVNMREKKQLMFVLA